MVWFGNVITPSLCMLIILTKINWLYTLKET